MMHARLPVAVVGAGPVGLAAAAHLLTRGKAPLVLEAGPAVGHAIRARHAAVGHVRMFTPWRFCVDRQAGALLAAHGWTHPDPDAAPTGAELVARYLEPLAALPTLAPHLHLGARVVGVSRKGADKVRTAGRGALPFVLRVAGADGSVRSLEARAVIDASGTWSQPNPAGADGLPAPGEAEAVDRIAYGIPDVLGHDRVRYAGRTTAVVGSGHSALNALIELAQLAEEAPGTRILWITRKEHVEAAYGGEAADALPGRGALGSQGRVLVEGGTVAAPTSPRPRRPSLPTAAEEFASMTVTIWHNPACGTSRNTLGLIRNSGEEPRIVEYLHTPPSREELAAAISAAGLSVRAALRRKGTPHDELGLDDPTLSDDALLDAMGAHPVLINRPFVFTDRGVRLCRPSELVLDLLPPQRGAFTKEDGEQAVDAAGQRVAGASA